MKKIVAIVYVSVCVLAQAADMDSCAMIAKEEVAKILGEIKEGPKPKEAIEKGCEWTNMSGSWLNLSVYEADKWGMKKMGANDPTDISGLGEEAFSNKRGTDAELYVRKGKLMLEVRTSAGKDVARQIAEIAVKKLP